ncbi:F0F1 ATP synthase subunit A [Pelobacter propionicus]|uniref:ATP synthase subunit a 2 n=1 Tax=Pelobacter propionicus (strain DSM 2379 / NBRC 103807 / OttBd1) TaxID=338966 RepID=ATP62_PELPD|nr:F0F1 ATP synthase subunit A [Pelobacter propionicus]A1AMA7.1 RecName: Full=ATP synthase subunit a 2; AltName: Full=ATP synthase F0 sector subunit a 2; AltName: Full=F-ATPase subunit 6 2 [Pelobacter propionicus DSM 2379]ABK98477.1 ATP synthase F0 subcomplex A subunit [Pelobacter propionicus DSM 2379]
MLETTQALFHLGPLAVGTTVVTTWGIMVVLSLGAWLASRRLRLDPGPFQVALEGVVQTIRAAVEEVVPRRADTVFPFVATLWLFIGIANLSSLIPRVHSPTADLSATTALALLVFFSVHWFGIRIQGLRPYLRHYLSPSPFLLPFHVIGEITRTLALAVRLFGNMMSLETAALLVLLVAGLFAPIPLLMLHIVEALVQAYIFGMLTLVYIAGAIQSLEARRSPKEEET